MGIDRRPRTPHRKLRALAAYATKGQADGLTIYLTPGGQYAVIIDPTTPGLQGTSGLKILLDGAALSGLVLGVNGIKVLTANSLGLQLTASGLSLKLADTSLVLAAGGLAVQLATASGLAVSSGLKLAHAPVLPLFDDFADAGNGTTVETDLYTHSVALNQLAANGDKLLAEFGGTFVGSGGTATREVKVYFAGQVIFDSGAILLTASAAWTCRVVLIRVSSTTVRYAATFSVTSAPLAAYTAAGQATVADLSANASVMKITGQAAGAGAATNDIVAKLGTITYSPAA